LGELVQTTAGTWITPPTGTIPKRAQAVAPTKSSSGTSSEVLDRSGHPHVVSLDLDDEV
jgi:hypothetical protein